MWSILEGEIEKLKTAYRSSQHTLMSSTPGTPLALAKRSIFANMPHAAR